MVPIIIVFHHYQQTAGTVVDEINFYRDKFYFGYIVEFFIISGYVIYPYVNKISEKKLRLSEFYLNRFIRLSSMVSVSQLLNYEVLLYICV